jgi:hypothetical protein
MGEWFSIEVVDEALSARSWLETHGDVLVTAAIYAGATDWSWVRRPWGAVFEVEFGDEATWQRFRDLPAVRAALDAVPDRVHGVFIYRGRGGSSNAPYPRRPRPLHGAGAAALPLPEEAFDDDLMWDELTHSIYPTVEEVDVTELTEETG